MSPAAGIATAVASLAGAILIQRHMAVAWFGTVRRYPKSLNGWTGLLIQFAAIMLTLGGGTLLVISIADLLAPAAASLRELAFPLGIAAMCLLGPCVYWVEQRRFRRLVARVMPFCITCGYALRGLRAVNRMIRCPECGARNELDAVVDEFRHRKVMRRNALRDFWDP